MAKKKHAYLILAHHEFDILQCLISLLDDERNDIFIHFDAKVKDLPLIQCESSHLHIIEGRVRVFWGDVSQIQAEYSLLKSAVNKDSYEYYHILSGTHLPLYSQDIIHQYFDQNRGKQICIPIESNTKETFEKVNLYNFCMKTFLHPNHHIAVMSQRIRRVGISLQKFFGVRRNANTFVKASNWISLTHQAVEYLVSKEDLIKRKYRLTMCADEFFVPTELTNSSKKFYVKFDSKILKQDFDGAHAKTYTMSEYQDIIGSGCLFARKFSSQYKEVVDRIVGNINSHL